jgi:uncharacterized glyoxalase superfamily protein PhnB
VKISHSFKTTPPTSWQSDRMSEESGNYSAAPEWPPSVTPYIAVSDGRAAIEWYVKVLDARPRGAPYIMPDGTVGHAEIAIGDGVLMLAEGSDEVPVQPPPGTGTHSHTIHVQVDDADRVIDRARESGAQVEREPEDQPYGRIGVFVDPYGHRWMVNQPPARATRQRHGDVGYITMAFPDDERAKAFYGAVLGWEFGSGSVPRGWNVTDVRPMIGIAGGSGAETQLCYRVADMEAALDVVRAQGGSAGPADGKPYGLLADCTDNQGVRFHLWQPTD